MFASGPERQFRVAALISVVGSEADMPAIRNPPESSGLLPDHENAPRIHLGRDGRRRGTPCP
jgi:hypothetical protein